MLKQLEREGNAGDPSTTISNGLCVQGWMLLSWDMMQDSGSTGCQVDWEAEQRQGSERDLMIMMPWIFELVDHTQI